MVDEFDVEEACECVRHEIVGCYNCQPWEGGPVWLRPRADVEDILVDCGIEEEHWDEVLEELACPNCGTSLSQWDEVEVRSEYDKKVEAVLKQAQAPELVQTLWEFHDFLESYPYLGLNDPPGMGMKISAAVRDWTKLSLEPAMWFRARRLNEESRLFASSEMCAPDPTKVRVPEGRYNHTGQSFLYLSTRPETAFDEIRTADENICAMQKFMATESITVLDLGHDLTQIDPESDLLAIAIIYNGLVQDTPEHYTSWKPEYFVPRFIADCARVEGYDGILFTSATLDGDNLVVFPQKMSSFHPEGECEVFRWRDGNPQILAMF